MKMKSHLIYMYSCLFMCLLMSQSIMGKTYYCSSSYDLENYFTYNSQFGVCHKVQSGSRLQSCSNQVDIAIKEQNYLWYSCIYVPGGQPCDLKAGCKTKEGFCVPFNFEL